DKKEIKTKDKEKTMGNESFLSTQSTLSTTSTLSTKSTQEIPFSASGIRHPESNIIHLTYKELDKKSNRLARYLQGKGVAPGTIVAIIAERSIEMIIGLLGILKANGAYLPIDPNYPKERINYMLKDSGTGILLTELKELNELNELHELKEIKKLEELKELGIETIRINNIYGAPMDSQQPATRTIGRGEPCVRPSTQPRANDLVYIIYTSGTTGRPKGVAVRHSGVVNLVDRRREIFHEGPTSYLSQVAGQAFDAMASEVWPALLNGSQLHIIDNETRTDAEQMKNAIIRNCITLSFVTTILAQQMLELDWTETGVALQSLLTAGDRLSVYPTREYPFNLYNLYGHTEDSVWTTWTEVEKRKEGDLLYPHIGKPI
ncbi:MAG: AMP-binding protein, partial [bacterium]|nr:AMP-binding protein [bacterium]